MFILLRCLLVALNVISFIPQVRRMYRTKSTGNMSMTLVSFNVYSAMEQASLWNVTVLMLGKERTPALVTQNASELRDLFQVTSVWMILSIILWFAILYYNDWSSKTKILHAFVFVLAQIQINPFLNGMPHRGMGDVLSSIPHVVLFLNPAITGLAYHAFIHDRALPENPDSSSTLSLVGLAGQSLMHLILAVKWITVVPIPWENVMSGSVPLPGLWFFYNFFGWGIVENIVFAVINGCLFRIARKQRKNRVVCDDREKGRDEPLLGPV